MTNRVEAAKQLYDWGAKEVMVTYNTEVIVYDGEVHRCPIVSRNFSGRTGRGDTIFSIYITERCRCSVDDALRFSTVAVSLKME